MPEKEASQSEAAAGIDFLALEMEIDREIDSLFVPAVKRTQGTAEKSKAAGETHNFPESTPGPGIQESAASSGAGLDLDALQVEIDKEIDSLFVPAVKPGLNEGPVQTGRHEQQKSVQGRSPVMTSKAFETLGRQAPLRRNPSSRANPRFSRIHARPGHSGICSKLGRRPQSRRIQVEIDKEIDSLFVPAVKPGLNEGPVQTGRHEQQKSVQGRSPVMTEQSLRDTRKAGPPSTEKSRAAGQTHNFSESSPGPVIRESGASSGAGLNLDVLQIEIDKEIDSLFVPAVEPGLNEGPVQTGRHEQQKSVQGRSPVMTEQSLRDTRKAGPPSTEKSRAAGQTHDSSESTPGPGIQESAASSGAGLNLDALQVEIDKEIDSLFVPAVEPGLNEGPVQTGRHEQQKSVQGRSPVMTEQSLRDTRKAGPPSTEKSKAAGQTHSFSESSPGPGIQESAASSGTGLNLDVLQIEIDKEIDSLFVPAVEPGLNEGPVQTGRHEQPNRVQGRIPGSG